MTDTFRLQHKELNAYDKHLIDQIKADAFSLEQYIKDIPYGSSEREKALALTKLEECVMWAVKGITK